MREAEKYTADFRQLVALYARTKKLILTAEQFDPESRSNISVFKEQRDALDHIIRSVGAILEPSEGKDEKYVRLHFEKATSHLYRAAYDSLDGIGISCKMRLKDTMDGVSNEAIGAVFPKYWENVREFDTLQEKIADHRNAKDVGELTKDNPEEYFTLIEKLCALTQEVRASAGQMHEWEARHRKGEFKKNSGILKTEALKYFLFTVVGGLLFLGLQKFVFSKGQIQSTQTGSPFLSTNPAPRSVP